MQGWMKGEMLDSFADLTDEEIVRKGRERST